MSHRTLPSHTRQIRPSSGLASSNPRASSSQNPHGHSTQSSQLQDRIQEKRAELENLRQLRDLSAGLSGQMQQLEERLGTLSNGTEAVAAVLSNWHNVLRAVGMASQKIPVPKAEGNASGEEGEVEVGGKEEERHLPQTLVRIPIQQAEAVRREAEGKEEQGG